MNRTIAIALGMCTIAAVGVAAGYWLATHRTVSESKVAAADAKTPLYWHDPMNPQQRFDKPGKSPFMDMELVPVYSDIGESASAVSIDSRVAQNLGVRTAEVTEGSIETEVEATGAVAFDERAVAVVQARVNGYVERLFVRAPLDPVSIGQPLAELLAPEWVAAQEEYLALRASSQADDALKAAARQRLVLLGIPSSTIAAIEADGKARARITVTAPIAGVVAELGAREGMSVAPGAMLFRINGLASVWINAEIPESQSASVTPGISAIARVPAYPNQAFEGRVAAILPEVNAATRTLKARVEISNPRGQLKPGMYATVTFAARERPKVTLVPSEAVIRTGERSVVMVADGGDGKLSFRAVDVEVGSEAKGLTEIRKGLERGMRVVVSGQFLIDSESSLKSTAGRLVQTPAPPAAPRGNVK